MTPAQRAHEKGYRVNAEGQVIGPRGHALKLLSHRSPSGHVYLRFAVTTKGLQYKVYVHKLRELQEGSDGQ